MLHRRMDPAAKLGCMAAQDTIAALRSVFDSRDDVELALLFGSTARGQARADSDVDVAVHAPSADLLELAARISDATAREVDIVALADATLPLLEELVRDSIVIHEGRPGAAARWRFHALLTLETDGPIYRRMRDAFLAKLASASTVVRPGT